MAPAYLSWRIWLVSRARPQVRGRPGRRRAAHGQERAGLQGHRERAGPLRPRRARLGAAGDPVQKLNEREIERVGPDFASRPNIVPDIVPDGGGWE